jgi:hypothetical protein
MYHRFIRALMTLVLLIGAVAAASTLTASPAMADAAGQGGDYVALPAPANLLDTRSGSGATAGKRAPGSTTTFQVLGRSGVPAGGVSAVLVDVTAVTPSTGTYLTAFPAEQTSSPVAAVNAVAAKITSNSAVVQIGASGRMSVFNSSATTDIVVDVHGYFLSSTSSGYGGFVATTPTRLVDTRSGTGTPKKQIAAGGTLTVKVGNGAPVPATATAAMLNIIVPSATKGGWLGVYATGSAAGGSTMDFEAGTSSTGTGVKLGTTGQVTFANHSAAPIDLVFDSLGYFSATPTEGAGLRPIAGRLIDTRTTSSPVPAGGTVDVAVGGAFGLPTRGIAGAVVNLVAVSPTAGGFLRAWPLGGAEPSTSLTNFATGVTRGALAVVPVGTEGKIRVRNSAAQPVHLIVELDGWFADPLPGVPVASFAPAAGLQVAPTGSTLGALHLAYTNNIGQLVWGRIDNPDSLSPVWQVISGLEAFSGTPGIAEQPNGNVQISAQNTDSNIWAITQADKATNTWTPWSKLGGSMATRPTTVRLADGRLVQFAVDADGRLWRTAQSAVNGAYGFWTSLGDADLAATPVTATVRDGLRLFAVDTAGALKTAVYGADGTLSAWTSLGGTGLNGTPATVVYPGYRVRVFVRDADGNVVTKAQDSTGAFGATWDTVGTFTATGSPAAVLNPVTGRTDVFARAADGFVYLDREQAQGSGTWGDWGNFDSSGIVSVTDPTIVTYTNTGGPTYMYVTRDRDNVTYVHYPSSNFALRATGAERPTFVTKALPAPPA